MPDVSVVIPTKDRLPYLPRVIQTCLAQPEVKEIVFVIDGSTDGSLEYLKQASAADNRIRYANNVVNRGTSYSRNRGIELATCEYTFTAEDDLTLQDGFLATLLTHLEETGADIISARNIFQYESESKAEALARTDNLTGPIINRKLITVQVQMNVSGDQAQPLLPSPMLGKTETFRKVGWDEYYKGSAWREESDLQLEALAAGYRLVYCPHTISYNLVIENDTGGAHMLAGFRRIKSITRNNWYFIHKHRAVIAREFGVTNLHVYIAKFTSWKIWEEMVRPFTVNAAHKILVPFRKISSLPSIHTPLNWRRRVHPN